MELDERIIKTASRVGRNVGRDWPLMEPEDITQHVLVCVMERPEDYQGLDDSALYGALKRAAVSWCARERADYIHRTARYVYTPSEVRELVALWAEGYGGDWANPPTRDGYIAAPDAGNITVSVWDIQEAATSLPENYREIIGRKLLGEEFGGADRRTYYRAIDRLTEHLNRVVNRSTFLGDGPGTRRVMSNTQANAVTHNAWSG